MKIHVINGPNLNMVGKRDPSIYGSLSYAEIIEKIKKWSNSQNLEVEFFQSNHEGEIIDYIQSLPDEDGIVINPGAYAHYSYSIRDALETFKGPKVEVHLSNIFKREEFRARSVISRVCDGVISGLGWYGYILGIEYIMETKK
ncbi:MAG: type II 3-dehydroquinate dehydratase [Mesoaciditoga sp.]|uniref:type II 3-dehydroquinate dehydratase n=1 Tax=Athalassotoga sp. TaxID=2022597 RepID=UPI000CAAE723|nr:MAG: type II 3-dehydroquinate dehydratase [Mesoaciditoga sp.]PMP79061.1 MAG: type II 3-dehydroquinate dehydratase [Mesoaciditoga sp.]HEU24494.1 type II 3-dehydroquinate dehydratase [Mesoaciditoga lauensis]